MRQHRTHNFGLGGSAVQQAEALILIGTEYRCAGGGATACYSGASCIHCVATSVSCGSRDWERRLCVERNARFLVLRFPWLLRGSLALFKKPMVPIPHISKRMFYTACRRLQLTCTFLGQGFGWPSLDPFILDRPANFCFCPCFTVCSSLCSWPISLLFIEALAPAPFVCGPYRRRAS